MTVADDAEITRAGKKKVQQAIYERMNEALRVARREVPVDTGTLKNSLNVDYSENFGVILGSDVEYAPYVEFGTVDMDPQPFIRPALRSVDDR